MPPIAILVVSVIYGATSFAAAQATFAGNEDGTPLAGETRFRREMVRMVVVLLTVMVGAILESRRESEPGTITPADVVMGAFVLAGLSAAVIGGLRAKPDNSDFAFYLGLAPLVVVVFVSFLESHWFAIGAGALCALPFAVSGYFFPRPSSTEDAMCAGLVGAAMSLFPAMAVLFAGCLVAIGVVKIRNYAPSVVRFSPFVAGLAIVGLLVQISLTP